jgi:DNA-binding CsgD family transcriptional regulator
MYKYLLFILTFLLGSRFICAQNKIDSLQTVLAKTTEKKEQLTVLDDLTKALIRNNDASQEKYLKAYLTLANELTEYDLMASKSRFLIQFYISNGQMDVAKRLSDSLLNLKEKYTKESSEGHVLLKRAAIYYHNENLEAARRDYKRSAELFMKSGDSIFAADALFFGGQASTDNNKFLEAIEQYKNAAQLYEALNDQQYMLLAGAELTSLYSVNGFVEKSIQERVRLIEKAKKIKDYLSYRQLLGQNVAAYFKLRDFDNMQRNLQEMIRTNDSLKNPEYVSYGKLFINNYQLLLACETNDVEAAKMYFQQLKARTSEGIIEYLKTDILNAKAAYYELIGDEDKFLEVLQSMAAITDTRRISTQTEAREKLAEILSKRGQYKEVVKLYALNAKVKDSVYKAQKTNAFLYHQAEFENEKRLRELSEKEAEIKRLETEQQLANNKRNAIIIILIILFVGIALFIYFRNRQKLKEQAYKNILLNNKIASKTEEINELLTETILHIKSKERITEDLQKLSTETDGVTLKSIIADLKANKADDDKLILIKQNIEEVNFEFIKKLKTQHPELTKTDVEICSLIRVGLSRKEVASLRNTSLEAVKTSRFRLKKKLKLATNQKLDTYIKNL